MGGKVGSCGNSEGLNTYSTYTHPKYLGPGSRYRNVLRYSTGHAPSEKYVIQSRAIGLNRLHWLSVLLILSATLLNHQWHLQCN